MSKGDQIYYKEGYKYQLTKDYSVYTAIFVDEDIVYPFFTITKDGWLHIKAGYAWDGASGPTFDTKSSMRASLVHDCFCQAAKDRRIDYDRYSPLYNALFYNICIEDNMFRIRATIWYMGVTIGRGGDPETPSDNEILIAP